MNKNSRPACIYIVRHECTKWRELREKYLNSLQTFIFPMCFLKTNNVVVLGQSREVNMFLFPGAL